MMLCHHRPVQTADLSNLPSPPHRMPSTRAPETTSLHSTQSSVLVPVSGKITKGIKYLMLTRRPVPLYLRCAIRSLCLESRTETYPFCAFAPHFPHLGPMVPSLSNGADGTKSFK